MISFVIQIIKNVIKKLKTMNMKIFCVISIIVTKVNFVLTTPTDAFYDRDGKMVFVTFNNSNITIHK